VYVKSSVSQASIGELSVDIIEPINKRSFNSSDWYTTECEQIETSILNSGNNFVSFMHKLVSHLLLNGQDIKTFLGIDDILNVKTGQIEDDADEDFA